MNEKVRHAKDRFSCFFSDRHPDCCAVLFHHHAVQGERQRYPLVFLHPSIIMRFQHRQICILIQRILFQIQPRRINVGSQNIHPFFHRLLTDVKERHRFPHTCRIYLISRFQSTPGGNDLLQIFITMLFCLTNHLAGTLALRFAF